MKACRGIIPDLRGLEALEDRRLLSVPANWANQDIGTTGDPGLAGSTAYAGAQAGGAGNYSITDAPIDVTGGGSDIWNNADHFQYAYDTVKMDGDGYIIATINSLVDATTPAATQDGWAKAGVMFREDLTAGSRQVSMDLTGGSGNGQSMQWRTTTNGGSGSQDYGGTAVTAPQTYKLERQGNTFTASYWDINSSSFKVYGRQTLAMPEQMFIGLNVTAHDNGSPVRLSVANYTNIQVQRNGTQFYGPTNPSIVGLAAGAYPAGGHDLNVTWADNAYNETGYLVMRATAPFNPADPSFKPAGYTEITLPADAQNYRDSAVTVGTQYYYAIAALQGSTQSSRIYADQTAGVVNGVAAHGWDNDWVNYGPEIYGPAHSDDYGWDWNPHPDAAAYQTLPRYWDDGTAPIAGMDNGNTTSVEYTGRFRVPVAPDGNANAQWTIMSRTDDSGYLFIYDQGAPTLVSADPQGHGVRDPDPTLRTNNILNPITLQSGKWYNFVLNVENGGGGAGAEILEIYNYVDNLGAQQQLRQMIPVTDMLANMDLPTAPSGVTVDTSVPYQVTLNWTNNGNSTLLNKVWRSEGSTFDPSKALLLGDVYNSTTTFTDGALLPNTQYTYKVEAWNWDATAGATTGAITTGANTQGPGLLGQYYNDWDPDFSTPGGSVGGALVAERFDAPAAGFHFDFDTTPADPPTGFNHDQQGVTWTGMITPTTTDDYTFGMSSDDGVRLWVNGDQLDMTWAYRGSNANAGAPPQDIANHTLRLVAGQSYPVTLAFFNGGGGSNIDFWAKAATATGGNWVKIPGNYLSGPNAKPTAPIDLSVVKAFANMVSLRFTDTALNQLAGRLEISPDNGATWQTIKRWNVWDGGSSGTTPSMINHPNGASQVINVTDNNVIFNHPYLARVVEGNALGETISNVVSFTTIPGTNGTLTINQAAATGDTNLTAEGKLDWADWGNSVGTIRKMVGIYGNVIGNYTVIGGTATAITGLTKTFSWTDGQSTDGTDITNPGDVLTAIGDRPNGPNEGVDRVIDNNFTGTKYLNFTRNGAGFIVTPSGSGVVNALSLTSANDTPGRDPATYVFSGSNDGGTTWTLISRGNVPAFTARFQTQRIYFANSATYGMYKLVFPTVAGPINGPDDPNSMQIEEVELLHDPNAAMSTVGTGVQISGAGTGFHLDIQAGATARTLKLYVEATNTVAQLAAQLTDYSSPSLTDATLDATGTTKDAVYTISFNADPTLTGQILHLDLTSLGTGSVAILAADIVDTVVPAAPNSPTYGTVGASFINLNWADQSTNEQGFRIERSTNGDQATPTWTPVTTVGAGVTSFRDTALTANTAYWYRVFAVNSAGDSASAAVFAKQSTSYLPAGWTDADVGQPRYTGDASVNATTGVWTVRGGGGDMWGTNDEFNYVYLRLANAQDTVAQARILGMSQIVGGGIDGWMKAGLDIRQSLFPTSPHFLGGPTWGSGLSAQGRDTTFGLYNANGQGFTMGTTWFRVGKSGDNYQAYWSNDGIIWNLLYGTTTLAMGNDIYIGLAVTAHNEGNLNQATFDNVRAWDFSKDTPVAPALTLTGFSPTSVSLDWGASYGATSIDVLRGTTSDPTQMSPIALSQFNPYTDNTVTAGQIYYYALRANNGNGASYSNVVAVKPAVSGTGISGTWFNSTDTNRSHGWVGPALMEIDPSIDFPNLAANRPAGAPQDNSSVIWNGYISPNLTNDYTFFAFSDDSIRGRIGDLAVPFAGWSGSVRQIGTVRMVAGTKYPTFIQWENGGGGTYAVLYWKTPGGPMVPVPQYALFPAEAPAAPSNLTAGIAPTQLSLNFVDNATNETSYLVEYSSTYNPGNPSLDSWQPLTTTSFPDGYFSFQGANDGTPNRNVLLTINDLAPSTPSFYVRVVALNPSADQYNPNRGVSNVVRITMPNAFPTANVTITPGSASSVNQTTEGNVGWIHTGYGGATVLDGRNLGTFTGAIQQGATDNFVAFQATDGTITDPNGDGNTWKVITAADPTLGTSVPGATTSPISSSVLYANRATGSGNADDGWIAYTINFANPGNYKLYIRRKTATTNGNDNSLRRPNALDSTSAFSTYDNATPPAAPAVQNPDTGAPLNEYSWDVYDNVVYNAVTAGAHTLTLAMREGQYIIDRIVLSQNTGMTNLDLNRMMPFSDLVSTGTLSAVTGPTQFNWTDGFINKNGVNITDGVQATGNAGLATFAQFNLKVPASKTARTLQLYIGAPGGANLSANLGDLSGSNTTTVTGNGLYSITYAANADTVLAVTLTEQTPGTGVILYAADLMEAAATAPTGVVATTKYTRSSVVQWNDVSDTESGFRIERQASTDGGATFGAWSTIANVGADTTSYRDGGLTAGSTYQYRVTARAMGGDASTVSNAITMGPALPAPWLVADIGTSRADVNYDPSTNNGEFKLSVNSNDVWGGSDSEEFVYQPWTAGDVQVELRINDQTWTSDWNKAGIQIRQSLDPAAPAVHMFVTRSNGAQLQGRIATNHDSYGWGGVGDRTAPVWVRLIRVGDSFMGMVSTDRVNWNRAGQYDIPMTGTVYVGLFATTNNGSGGYGTIGMDNVQILPFNTTNGSGTANTLAPVNLEAKAGSGVVRLLWNGRWNQSSFNIYRSTTAGAETLLASGVKGNRYFDTAVTDGTQYFYKIEGVSDDNVVSPKTGEVNATPAAMNFGSGFATSPNLQVNAVATITGGMLQLTQAANSLAGSAFTVGPVNNFKTAFDFKINPASANVADGFTFAIQSMYENLVGWNGGGMGYESAMSGGIALRINDYSGNGVGIGIYQNGGWNNQLRPILTNLNGINLQDADVKRLEITYDGTKLTWVLTDPIGKPGVSATDSVNVNIPALASGNYALVGFTGGTGGLNTEHDILNWTYSSLASPLVITGPADYIKLVGGIITVWPNTDGSGAPSQSQALASTTEIDWTGTPGNDTLVLDLSGGNFIPPGGLKADGGAGTDTVLAKGFSGAFAPVPGVTLTNIEKIGFADGSVTLAAAPGGFGLVATGTATVTLTSSMDLPSLDVTGNGKVIVAAGGTKALTIGPNATPASLNIADNGILDVNDNGIILAAGNATDRDALLGVLTGLIKSARGTNGAWAGTTGVLSSAAKADYAANNQAFTTGIAVTSNIKLDANGNVIGPLKTTFKGQTVDQNAVLAAYSFNGDTNLDGVITFDDYFKINTGFLSNGTLKGYQNGDFTFDGLINFDDYFLINTAFLGQGSKTLPPMPKTSSPFSKQQLTRGGTVTKLTVKKKLAGPARHHKK